MSTIQLPHGHLGEVADAAIADIDTYIRQLTELRGAYAELSVLGHGYDLVRAETSVVAGADAADVAATLQRAQHVCRRIADETSDLRRAVHDICPRTRDRALAANAEVERIVRNVDEL